MPSSLPKVRSLLPFVTAVGLAATLVGALERNRPIELPGLAVLTFGVIPLLFAVARGWMARADVLALRDEIQAEAFALAIELWRAGQLDSPTSTDADIPSSIVRGQP